MIIFNLKIEVICKNENYNLINRDKNKAEKLTKREKVKKQMIGITTFVTLSIYAFKALSMLYDLIAAL